MKDSFGREITYLRLSVTDLCNLRCRYCMPESGVCKKEHADMLSFDEISTAVMAAASLGVTKVRITGGEPLVKNGIVEICRSIASVGGIEEVCITTNGLLLPEMSKQLAEAGVSRVNISLDTLKEDRYTYITRGGKLDDALHGIESALETGFEKVKINAVLIGGFNDDEIADLADLTRKWPVDVRFIELMPMYDSGDFKNESFISNRTVIDRLPDLIPLPEADTTAKLYKFDNAKGMVGLISPVYDSFCSSCNRIRLTSDGKIKPCLHSNEEYPTKGMTYDEMVQQFKTAITAKPKCHGVLSYLNRSGAERSMNEIGG